MSPAGIPPHLLARLRKAFVCMLDIEGKHPDIDWEALLELREQADLLTDDTWFRGYLVGVLDAVGVSVGDALQILRTASNSSRPQRRRRIVEVIR